MYQYNWKYFLLIGLSVIEKSVHVDVSCLSVCVCELVRSRRGVNVYKRNVATHSSKCIFGIRFGHYMSSCIFSLSIIGHILA